jgi:hypothetical protein
MITTVLFISSNRLIVWNVIRCYTNAEKRVICNKRLLSFEIYHAESIFALASRIKGQMKES